MNTTAPSDAHGYYGTPERAWIPLPNIVVDRPRQPPQALLQCMAEEGQVQPILVWLTADGNSYTLCAGGKRVACAIKLGWTVIEAYVYETEFDAKAAARITLAENVRGYDPFPNLDAVELLGEDEAMQVTGMTRGAMTALLKYRNLDPVYQAKVSTGDLSLVAARALAELPPHLQHEAWKLANLMAEEKGKAKVYGYLVVEAVQRKRRKLQPLLPASNSLPAIMVDTRNRPRPLPDRVVLAQLLRQLAEGAPEHVLKTLRWLEEG